MQVLFGSTLQDRIRSKSLETDEILELAIEITDALHAAHSKGIVHRDIKARTFSSLKRDMPRCSTSAWPC